MSDGDLRADGVVGAVGAVSEGDVRADGAVGGVGTNSDGLRSAGAAGSDVDQVADGGRMAAGSGGPGGSTAAGLRPCPEVSGAGWSGPDPQPRGLEIRDVSVVYRSGRRGRAGIVRAVDHVSLSVGPGEIVALLGPSGCGKSSLLRAVAGLEDVAGGQVCWDGQDVVRVPVHRRGFGLMFQDGQLFPFRDVAGNVAYGIRHLPRAQRRRRVEEMLELVGLPGYGARPVTTLSGGQAQRVALARALAPAPRLLGLDEPLSALDRALRESLVGELRRILTAQGTTALYVTHDHEEAAAVADRVGVMREGRLVACGTWDEVRAVV